MRAEISNSRVKSRFHICSFVALNSFSSDSLTFTLKMLLMTPPPSFYTEMCVLFGIVRKFMPAQAPDS